MAPSRRKGSSKAAAAAAARRQWKVGDLVLAKLKGFPAWPATVSEPEKWGFSADWKKVLVYFFGTQQIAFCNPADVEAFTEEKKQTLLVKRQGKGADFVRAVQEIIDIYDKAKKQEQVDDLNSGTEVTAANCGKSVESSPKLQLKEVSESPAETSDAQSKSSNLKVKTDCNEHNLPGKEAKVPAQVDDLHVEPEAKEPVLCTYSLRKKSGGLQVESTISRRRVPPVRRSRNSSRAEASRLEISSNSAQDAASLKSRLTRKISDISKGDDRVSPTSVQNGSVEDSGSEIVSMESESTSFNDGSAADSCFQPEHYEIVTDCVEGEIELKKGLDLQINTVLKKKRKPNRKRVICDAAEPSFNACNGTAPDAIDSAAQDFESTFARTGESFPKDDGDEHLPLLKRARVRMGEILSKEDENNVTSSIEKVLKEIPENSSDLNHYSFREEKVLKEVEVNALGHNNDVTSHAEEEISKEGPVHESLNSLSLNHDPTSPCINRETSDGVSDDCTELSDQLPSLCKLYKSQSCVSSADGEAALPPSKRLHRALEAMSANAAHECPSSHGASSVLQPASSSFSSQRSPCIAIDCETGNVLRQHVPDFDSNHVSDVRISLSPVHLNKKISREADTVEKMDFCEPSSERPESPLQLEKVSSVIHEDVKIVCTSMSGTVDNSLTEMQSTRTLSTTDEAREPALRLNHALHEPSCADNETNAAICEFVNSSSREKGAEKQPDPPESTGRSPCSVAEVEKITAVSSGCGIEALWRSSTYNSENGGNEQMRVPCGCSSQDDIVCHVNETRCDQVMRENNHVSCSNSDLDNNDFPSSYPGDRIDSSPRVSQLNSTRSHICSSDDDGSRNSKQDNGSCSPIEVSHLSNSAHNAADPDRKLESSVMPPTFVGKNSNYSAAHAALSSFEAVLGSLKRTKDSISRATHIAFDCAKLGFASEAFEVLAHSLENESSLYRRVDMFFLVDSIMQWSRGLKGDAGSGFLPLIQEALPRLLSAAAPPGSSAHENRRQCLKVLRLWLERKFLPDSILRHHIRELDVFIGPPSANPYSRRSSRNERAFDDPVREMEGMLVDEYGSNSSFQLPGFCMPQMLKVGDEGSDSDSDGSFEAVTPEHTTSGSPQLETTTMGKHRHILQDVDGELEMEDVAPPEVKMVSTENSQNVEQQYPPPPHAAPQQLISPHPPPPPSPVPLPPPLPLHPPHSNGSTISDCHINRLHQNSHANAQNVENLAQPLPHPPVPSRTDQRMLGASHYHHSEGREPQQQMPMHNPSNSSYSRRSMENGDREDVSRFNNGRGYHMRPHYAPPSNHFSHGHSDQRGRPRRDGPLPYSGRNHHQHNRGNGNYHNSNHERMKPPPYEARENWRFSAPYSGPRYPEKGKSNCSPGPHGGPPYEPERFPNHGWSSYPPRPMGHRNHMPYRPHYEGPEYWRPR